MEERIIELETKVAFQEDAISELREVTTTQEQQILKLERELKEIRAQLIEVDLGSGGTSEEPPPPHY